MHDDDDDDDDDDDYYLTHQVNQFKIQMHPRVQIEVKRADVFLNKTNPR